jgi:hypothetical protein
MTDASQTPGEPGSTNAAEQTTALFVASLQRRESLAVERLREEIKTFRTQERMVFAVSIVAAFASIALVFIGSIQVIRGKLPAASLSAGMAVFSGVGTAYLRWMAKDIRERRDQLAAQEDEEAKALRAVGITLMIPDHDKRDSAMAELASRMAADAVSRGSGRAVSKPSSRTRGAGARTADQSTSKREV